MASETDLLNGALGQIGASTITAIDDGSINANHCQRFYPTLLDSLIRSHHWNFAVTRTELAQDVATPATEFAYQYTLPSDPWCLKVIEYAGANPSSATTPFAWPWPDVRNLVQFKIEGRKLLSNDGQAFITYLARITNPDQWDAIFYQMTETWLASKLASAITKDDKKSMSLLTKAQQLWFLATSVDGQEGSVEPYVIDDLIWGR